jgi:hypothetical protein
LARQIEVENLNESEGSMRPKIIEMWSVISSLGCLELRANWSSFGKWIFLRGKKDAKKCF